VRANSREGTSGLSEARGVRPPRDALLALSRTHAILQSTHLELTKRCNLRCYHCYVAGTSVELPVSRWLEVVDELEVEGCLHVTLTGGEVGLKHGWLQIAERVKRRRMTLRVLTNGTVFSPEDIGRLADLRPLLVGISLYGGTAVVHERVTGVPGSFDRSIASLRALRERDVRCRIACTLMPETLPGVDEIADLAEQLDCEFVADPTVVTRADGEDSVLDYRLPVAQVREYLGSDRLGARRSQSRQVGGAGRHRTGPPCTAAPASRRRASKQMATCCRAWVFDRPSGTLRERAFRPRGMARWPPRIVFECRLRSMIARAAAFSTTVRGAVRVRRWSRRET
jgi:pyruvate-formate lyase-activating enzyme